MMERVMSKSMDVVLLEKFNRGKIFKSRLLIIGGIVRGDNLKCFFEFILNRDRAIIHEYI